MTNLISEKKFPCKYEEIAPIGRFICVSLKRDQVPFGEFSPRFTAAYVTETESLITEVENLVSPESEMLAKKQISTRMAATATSLLDDANKTEAYLKLARPALNITGAAFGISALRNALNNYDYEGIGKGLTVILQNIDRHQAVLAEQGLSEAFRNRLATSQSNLKKDAQERYELESNRHQVVHGNIAKLNELYDRILEIGTTGKAIFRNDPVKQAEYTFSELMKKVRRVSKKEDEAATTATPTENK